MWHEKGKPGIFEIGGTGYETVKFLSATRLDKFDKRKKEKEIIWGKEKKIMKHSGRREFLIQAINELKSGE